MNANRNKDSFDDTYGDHTPQRTKSTLDLLLNWVLLIGIIGIGIYQFERDWYYYEMEVTFYNTVQDGMTPDDMESAYMARGVERNMEYIGKSINQFFQDQWLPKLPFYLGGLMIPFLIGIIRLSRKSFRRWNVPYYFAWLAFLSATGYSLLTGLGIFS